MKIDLPKLLILKEKMRTATDLSEPMLYFFDHFADFPEFSRMCTPVKNRFLTSFMETMGKQFAKDENGNARMRGKFLFALPEYHFIHGSILINHNLLIVAYFEDVAQGIFVLVKDGVPIYGRITPEAQYYKSKRPGSVPPISLN